MAVSLIQSDSLISVLDSHAIFQYAWSFGLLVKILSAGISRFELKLVLFSLNLVCRMLTIPSSNSFAIFIQILTFLIEVLAGLWKEKYDRNLFKAYHDYREGLTKFKNLIMSGLPVSIIILRKDLKHSLFTNECFQSTFQSSLKRGNPLQIQDIAQCLNSLTIDKDNISYFPQESMAQRLNSQPNLLYFLEHFAQISHNDKHFCFNVRRHGLNEEDTKTFETKVFSFFWDGEDAIAVILDDVTQQFNNLVLQVADENKDRMVAMISHELRTPLNGILGVVSILEKKIKDVEILHYLTVCKNSGKLLLNLVNSILDLGQIRNDKLKLTISAGSLQKLIDDVYQLFEFQFKEKGLFLKVDIAVDENMPDVLVTDLNRLKQILINLIGNALKFTFKGGVHLSVSVDPNSEGNLLFKVSDSGLGIKNEDQKKLFQLYGRLDQTLDSNSMGVGLGLTISDCLVKLLSGRSAGIQVESQLGKGSVFSFSIKANYDYNNNLIEYNVDEAEGREHSRYFEPSIDTPSKKMLSYSPNTNTKRLLSSFSLKAMSPIRLLSPPIERKFLFSLDQSYSEDMREYDISTRKKSRKEYERILLVDDSPFNIMVAKNILETLGCEVTTALNGKIAVETVQQENLNYNKTFNLILMDCQMPVMDGYEATKILCQMMQKGEIPRIPIVALSANDTEKDKEKSKSAGMSDHLSKPLEENKLKEILLKFSH